MQDEVGAVYLVKRRFERLDKGGRKLAYETDCVGDGDLPAFGKPQLTRSRIERGEQLVV